MEIACDRPQHEAENKKIESVHRIAERGARQRLPRVAVDGGRHALDAVSRDAHFDTPPRLKSPMKGGCHNLVSITILISKIIQIRHKILLLLIFILSQ